jgi:hypothetical protein
VVEQAAPKPSLGTQAPALQKKPLAQSPLPPQLMRHMFVAVLQT